MELIFRFYLYNIVINIHKYMKSTWVHSIDKNILVWVWGENFEVNELRNRERTMLQKGIGVEDEEKSLCSKP